jgi:protein involved in plasmid replication-relaxation
MINTPARAKGLRKFIPQPDRYRERYGNFTLTERDMQILETVYRYRFLEARHVNSLVGGSDQQVVRRLQGLFHNGYLGRYARRERMRLELDPGAPLIAYGLELRGARALERQRAAAAATTDTKPTPVRWKKEYTRRTEWFLEHHLMVSNFRCALELATRESPDIELVNWRQGMETWCRVVVPGKQQRVARVAPDAYFELRQTGELHHFFLEVDRATEEHCRLVDRFVAYWFLLRPGRSAPMQRANVLFVTTGQQRLKNLIETLRETKKPRSSTVRGRGLFWFSCESDYGIGADQSLLTMPWRSAAGAMSSLCDYSAVQEE